MKTKNNKTNQCAEKSGDKDPHQAGACKRKPRDSKRKLGGHATSRAFYVLAPLMVRGRGAFQNCSDGRMEKENKVFSSAAPIFFHVVWKDTMFHRSGGLMMRDWLPTNEVFRPSQPERKKGHRATD